MSVSLRSRPGALVFDLDGTMYDQQALRLRMAWKLLLAYAASPRLGLATARMLRAYRHAQEALRELASEEPLESVQLHAASRASGFDARQIAECVNRWMLSEPLPLLAGCRRAGLIDLLEWAKASRIPVAVLSDYPARGKLRALGVDHLVDVVVTAQDSDVQRFKPDPRGLLVTLNRLGVSPAAALYLGDRPDVDGGTAQRAGVAFVLVTRSRTSGKPWRTVHDFHEMLAELRSR